MEFDRLVSTIIPVFNRPRLLEEAVGSVLAQTYRPIEIILVDDGSTDETPAVIEEIRRDLPKQVRVVTMDNAGPGCAREAGRQIARGEYIQYLDSDDLLLARKFELQVQGLSRHPECKVAYGMTRYRHMDGSVEPSPWKRTGERIANMFPSFLESRWWDTPNPLYRRSICDVAGPWSNFTVEEDWEYDCRVAAVGAPLFYVPHYVCEVRDHDDHRLCRDRENADVRARNRLEAHKRIYGHARSAGIDEWFPEMQHFARECFLLARQCGAAGMPLEAAEFFDLSRVASGKCRRVSRDMSLYRIGVAVLGWGLMGSLSSRLDAIRN